MGDQPLIKTVIFDLGNVVLSFHNRPISNFIAMKSGFPEDEVHSFVFGTALENSIDRGEISLEDFLKAINIRFSSHIMLKEFTPVWCDMFTQSDGIEEIIRGLKNNSYRLGMLSNTNKSHFEFVKKKFPIIGLFDDYHLSYETGCLKPDKCAYENLVSFYGTEPRFLVFIDDLEINVSSARLYGINAFQYKSSAKLSSDLAGLGLKFQ